MTTRLLNASFAFVAFAAFLSPQNAVAEDLSADAATTMRKAAAYYRNQVAVQGGYVYYYSLDLKTRWGEGLAAPDQIWVQPPGTPTVGLAYLAAYEATGEREYLDAAVAAAEALVYGQLTSGGWTNLVDFNPESKSTAAYRNGRGRGKNNSTFDDGISQSAIRFLARTDEALEFKNAAIHEAVEVALDALLKAQHANGAFPQVWTGPVSTQPVVKPSYPDYDWRTEGRIKNYWDMYTLNDNTCGYLTDTLIEVARIYQDDRYLTALRKLGDFFILAQMPEPQPAWCQQYGFDMRPIWARKFEPPGISGRESQDTIEALLKIYNRTGDKKYLEPIPAAIAYLRRSQLPDGRLARYYELQTNKPLYMSRRGDTYSLTYDDSELPDHYGWKTESRLDELEAKYNSLAAPGSPVPGIPSPTAAELEPAVRTMIASLDDQGRWIDTYDVKKLMVGQPEFHPGDQYLASETFSKNLTTLSDYLRAVKPR